MGAMKAKTTAAKKSAAAKPKKTVAVKRSAAAKKPTVKKPMAKAAPKALLRGVALVDAVMAARRAKGERLEGMSKAELSATRFGERSLSPALVRWLESDAGMFTLGASEPLGEMLEREVGVWAEAFEELSKYLEGPVVLFEGWGCDSRRFLKRRPRDIVIAGPSMERQESAPSA